MDTKSRNEKTLSEHVLEALDQKGTLGLSQLEEEIKTQGYVCQSNLRALLLKKVRQMVFKSQIACSPAQNGAVVYSRQGRVSMVEPPVLTKPQGDTVRFAHAEQIKELVKSYNATNIRAVVDLIDEIGTASVKKLVDLFADE